ncbi:hypothetical protein P692DRAFT_20820416 [Suillus brevipes Sb2]|nr:hypothetical protein P692DRAFT_20820416 [Suillus brevipes Sb2]
MLSCFRLRVSVHYLLLVYLDLMRCQQVIDACISLGEGSPIQNSHDVGAGGLPELVHDSVLGAKFEIRDVPVADSSMSPMEIWCNESQERDGVHSLLSVLLTNLSAASKASEGAGFYAAVATVGMKLCPALGIGIPVGKNLMSMCGRSLFLGRGGMGVGTWREVIVSHFIM